MTDQQVVAQDTRALRSWSAIGHYPNKKAFVFGTVMLPLDARHDEIMAALRSKWADAFPIDSPPVFDPIMGTVWFRVDGE